MVITARRRMRSRQAQRDRAVLERMWRLMPKTPRRRAPIIHRRPDTPLERRLRREYPSVVDLARLTPLQRWKRGHTEDLREPLPGSGLVVAGEVSLPWRKYALAAAHGQVPPALRVHQRTDLYEHTIAPHEHHDMRPVGEQPVTWEDVKRRYITSVQHKYVPQAAHVHRFERLHEDGIKLRWECELPGCGQSGYEDYTLDTLAATTRLVWHECAVCSRPEFWNAARPDLPVGAPPNRAWGVLSERDYYTLGLGEAEDYLAWLRAFSGLRPIPAIRGGAANIFYVDWANGNDTSGNGSSSLPWKTLNKARTQMVTNDGDTVRMRGADVSGQRYNESFPGASPFPSGPSFAQATIIENDSGHTPTIMPSPAVLDIFEMQGSSSQYIIWRGLILDNNASGTFVWRFYDPARVPANSPHHLRITGCTARNRTVQKQSGFLQINSAHHIESLNSLYKDVVPPAANLDHGIYQDGADSLVDGCDFDNITGYGIHPFADVAGEVADRSVYRRNRAHVGTTAGLGRVGIQVGDDDCLCYYNACHDNASIGIRVRFGTSGAGTNPNRAKVFNNTIADNPGTGLWIWSSAVDTEARNNISVSNGTAITNSGSGTIQSNNSWQIGGFSAQFVNQAARDYHLGAGSSARNAGVSMASTINSGTWPEPGVADFDGQLIQEGVTDLGAYEFLVGSPPPPPASADVPLMDQRLLLYRTWQAPLWILRHFNRHQAGTDAAGPEVNADAVALMDHRLLLWRTWQAPLRQLQNFRSQDTPIFSGPPPPLGDEIIITITRPRWQVMRPHE